MNAKSLETEILSLISPPKIPNKIVNVLDYGAKAQTSTPQTKFIQNAIDTVSANGGGVVVIPQGNFLTGALRLKSGVELRLESPQSALRFYTNADDGQYPQVLSHWEGTPCYNYSPLLYAINEKDIAVTGCGTLDGQASYENWWSWHHQEEKAWCNKGENLQDVANKRLRIMNRQGVDVQARRFGKGDYLRPNFIQFLHCERVLLQGITICNSPMWNINPVFCKSLIVRGVSINSHGPNSDGCDPESCTGVLIENNTFDTGDDCISLKSGRDADGRAANTPCSNVVIRNNKFADGHGGIALGSEMSGGICKVVAINNEFDSPNLTYALRLKSNAQRGGTVEQIVLSNSIVRSVSAAAVHGTMMYEDGRAGDFLPVFRDILIENIEATGGDYGIFLEAFPEVPITGLTLRNINIKNVKKEMYAANWQNPVLENVVINNLSFPRPYNACILGVPTFNARLKAKSSCCVETQKISYIWQCKNQNEELWQTISSENELIVPKDKAGCHLRVVAVDQCNNKQESANYLVLENAENPHAEQGYPESEQALRLQTRNMILNQNFIPTELITRESLARMILPLLNCKLTTNPLQTAINQGAMAEINYELKPQHLVTRQELATVAMQCCGVSYKNASTTMPICNDVNAVSTVHGTHVARALYYNFLQLDENGNFNPLQNVSVAQAICTLNNVADFAGL